MVIGRFAPSPTGPLHFGSLVAAVASYCDAKSQGGKWLLRIEDVDTTRSLPNSTSTILQTLTSFGFEWEGDVLYQSQRSALYQAILDALIAQGLVYACTCSRKEIADSSVQQGVEGHIYPGTCLAHPPKQHITPAWRMKTPSTIYEVEDALQGRVSQSIAQAIGDFVLKRADGCFSYQLAVVVDDAAQGVTHVVRGQDLLLSTPRQLFLQDVLGYPQPKYAHIPLVTHANGEKLSKQTLALPIAGSPPVEMLVDALSFLGQAPPVALKKATLAETWHWAIHHWRLANCNRPAGHIR